MGELQDGNKIKCEKCDEEIDEMLLLPCKHVFCYKCIKHVSDEAGISHGLQCPRAGCVQQFAIPTPPDPKCNPKATISVPFVGDHYHRDVRRLQTISKPTGGKKIMGMTLLGASLFAVSGKEVVYEYNVENVCNPQMHTLPGLRWPRGLAASKRLQVLYVTDWSRVFGGSLWRFHAGANKDAVKVDLPVQPFGVSVCELQDGGEVRVLVTCATPASGRGQRVLVFKDDGRRLVKVGVDLPLPSSFEIPRHAVPLSSTADEIAVCHGWTRGHRHRVSKMSWHKDSLNETVAYGSYAGSDEQQVHCPLSLCVDEDGLLLVVDYYNHRIQLLTHHLQLVRHLITKQQHGIEYPRHVCLDSARGVLYVGLQSGEIHAFKVRQ